MPKPPKLLNDLHAPYIQPLARLIETQSKTTLANWAIDYSGLVILPIWIKYYPNDLRPQYAISAAREWLSGAIKLPKAKSAILECHAAARKAAEYQVAQAAARAIAQSASTIHSARHCIGLALYGALAVAYETLGMNTAWEQVEECAAEECGRMFDALRSVAIENEPTRRKTTGKCSDR